MQPLRDYQARAVDAVRQHWAAGTRRVLLVSPTGSGKTRMGEALADAPHLAWFAHRTELIGDAAARLRAAFGVLDVGIIAPKHPPSPYSRIQVATIQTALARGVRPPASRLVLDEAHHFVADDWSKLLASYPEAELLLLTATPERQDGRGLDDIADVMVVAAEYSELLEAGHLVGARVFQPEQVLGNALAQDPVDAWERFSAGGRGFAFFSSVDMCYSVEHRMNERGIRAAVVEQGTDRDERRRIIQRLRDGELDCICNVYTMTEGVDVPQASVCMLASACRHCGGYLQKVGRVLRPHPSKTEARVIDLVGATLLHGLPTENRIYSLSGEPIKRRDMQPLKQCKFCFALVLSATTECSCGWKFTPDRTMRRGPKIHSLELREVYAGKDTPANAKLAEYKRLREEQKTKGYDLYWVQSSYRALFGEAILISDATLQEKMAFRNEMAEVAKSKGFKRGFLFSRFRAMFGHAP